MSPEQREEVRGGKSYRTRTSTNFKISWGDTSMPVSRGHPLPLNCVMEGNLRVGCKTGLKGEGGGIKAKRG